MATSSSDLSSISSYTSAVSDMPKNADYYLPPIVRSLGEDVVVNKVRLQCKAVTNGRYLYTYTMDLAQDHPQGLRTDRSIDLVDYAPSNQAIQSTRSKKSSRGRKDSSTDYSVKSYHVRQPQPVARPIHPQTTVSVHKPVPASPPNVQKATLTDFTIRSIEDENSAEIRQEVTITFYLFGQTTRGDYFRLRQFDAFLAKMSLRRVLKVFAEATDHSFKDFLDHLYVLPGCGETLNDVSKWQKIPRDHISMTIRDLRFNKQPFTDEFVLIVDLIGVHAMSPAIQRQIRKK